MNRAQVFDLGRIQTSGLRDSRGGSTNSLRGEGGGGVMAGNSSRGVQGPRKGKSVV